MDCSQEHVFWSTPLNSQSPFFSETFFIQTTQTYVVTVCGFVTFEGQLATFKDSSPKQSNYVDNGYQNSATFQGTRIKHTKLNFTELLEKRRNQPSLFIFVWLLQLLKQAVSTNKETNLGNTKSSRTMNKHYSREKVPFREPWKKKGKKERKKHCISW